VKILWRNGREKLYMRKEKNNASGFVKVVELDAFYYLLF
jgi:hypothetical protein